MKSAALASILALLTKQKLRHTFREFSKVYRMKLLALEQQILMNIN